MRGGVGGTMACGLSVFALLVSAGDAFALGKAGDVDPTFNGGQPVLVDLAKTVPRTTYFGDLAIDGAGRILASGSTSDAEGRSAVALARFTAGGALDPSFGAGGGVVAQLSTGASPYSTANSLFTVPGRYAGIGVYRFNNGRAVQSAYVFGSGGGPDLEFGSGGLATHAPATPPADTNVTNAAALPDGGVLTIGTYDQNGGDGDTYLTLSKFTPAGVAQTSFGNSTGGHYYGNFSQSANTHNSGAVALPLSNNKIIVVGTTELPTGRLGIVVARLTAAGDLDYLFGAGGGGYNVFSPADPSVSAPDSRVSSALLGPSGEMYIAGDTDDPDDRGTALIMRLTPAGNLDPTYGIGGVKRLQLGGVDETSYTSAIALQPDGKLVALVSVSPSGGGRTSPRLVRFNDDGSLDGSFGNGGVATPATGVGGITVAGDKLLVAGSLESGGRTYGVLGRYLLAPLPDPVPGGPAPAPTPPAGPGPAPQAPRAGALGFTAKALRVDAKGRVRLPLTCSAAGACTGKLAILAATGTAKVAATKKKKPKTAATYASARYTLKAGAKTTVTVTLKKSIRSKARGKKGLRVRVAILPSGAKLKTYKVKLHR